MIDHEQRTLRFQRLSALAAALLFFSVAASQAMATTLAELIEGAKKEGVLHGQWGGNSFGGAEGFPEETKQQADSLLSLSRLTMPHELARVVLLEQLYRAFALLHEHPYPR